MPLVASCPDKKARMVPYPEYSAFDILFKDLCFKRPVGRTLEFSLRVASDPEIGPDKEPVSVGCIKELITGSDTSSPYPHQVYVCVTAQPHLIVVPERIAVQHEIRHPGAPCKVNPPPVNVKIASPGTVNLHSFGTDCPDTEKKSRIVRESVLTCIGDPHSVEILLSMTIGPPEGRLCDVEFLYRCRIKIHSSCRTALSSNIF